MQLILPRAVFLKNSIRGRSYIVKSLKFRQSHFIWDTLIFLRSWISEHLTFTELRKSILDSFFGNRSEKTRWRNMARKILPSCYETDPFIQRQTNLLRPKKKKNQPHMEKKKLLLGTANCFSVIQESRNLTQILQKKGTLRWFLFTIA